MTDLAAQPLSPQPASLEPSPGPSRRQVLITGGVVVAAAAVTAACGSSGGSSTTGAASTSASTTPLSTADVPVGGGKILTDQKIVVTQPVAGTFKAFTAVCTHQGCIVASVADGTISCACHGSQFSATDGTVTGGPAPAPLAALPLTVSGTTITLG